MSRKYSPLVVASIVLVMSSVSFRARAQTLINNATQIGSTNSAAMYPTNRTTSVELRTGFRWEAPVDAGDYGRLSVERVYGGMSLRQKFSGDKTLILGVDVEHASYYFRGTDNEILNSHGLMNDAYSVQLAPMLAGRVNEKWNWMAGIRGSFSGEPGADVLKAGSGGLIAGGEYLWSERLKLLPMIVAFGYEGRVMAFPMVGVDWKINDRWRLASRGPGLDLSAKLDLKTTFTIRGMWDFRQYRLDDKDPAPEGLFADQRVNLGMEVSRRFFHVLELALETGTTVYRQIDVLDSDDEKLATAVLDPGLYVGARLGVRM